MKKAVRKYGVRRIDEFTVEYWIWTFFLHKDLFGTAVLTAVASVNN